MANSTVTVTGNLTRDAEIRYLPSGRPVASIRMAVNKSWKRDDEWQTEVSFYDVKAWGDLAERSTKLSKGIKVTITGELKQETWEDDGNKRSNVVIVASDIGLSLMGLESFVRVPKSEGFNESSASSKPAAKSTVDSDEPF